MNHIICAIATAPGIGGIAVIRVSGKNAIALVETISVLKSNKSLTSLSSHSVVFGEIIDKNKVIIDEVLFSVFRNPHSYTGEDVVEISCHGSIYIQQQILQLLISVGASLANPGEFTLRAFLNGKLDLSQAEAVADLISSSSAAEHRMAMNQMKGGFSKELSELRDKLLNFISLIELELDFSEEDVQFADRKQLSLLIDEIAEVVSNLVYSFKAGNAIKNGVPVAIVGETNAGKSTLLNLLLNEDRAIVSDIHGTTRDSIEDVVTIDDIHYRFIDTAGLRETDDVIESMGIERTYSKMDAAYIVILLLDANRDFAYTKDLIEKVQNRCNDQKLLLVFNKMDLLDNDTELALRGAIEPLHLDNVIYISAKYNKNSDSLKSSLKDLVNISPVGEHEVLVSNIRHYEALKLALDALNRVKLGMINDISSDFLSMDIRECMRHLAYITGGEIDIEEVLGNIFKNFCIGK